MYKRLISFLLAFVMILQIFTPSMSFAMEKTSSNKNENLLNIGEVSTEGYPSIDTKLILERNKEVARNRKLTPGKTGVGFRKSEYVEGSDPSDSNKPKYFGRVSAELITKGLDNGPFNWGEIFGQDLNGANKPVKIEFHQLLDDVSTGIQFSLEVNKDGTYKWVDGNGNPTLLPLYSIDFKAFKYSVFIDKGIAEKVKLIISLSAPTPDVKFEKVEDRFVADIEFKIDIQQVAATNFSSEWKTGVGENDRPQITGKYVFTEDGDEIETPFNFPKDETSRTVIRDGFVENFVEDEAKDILAPITDELINKPKEVKVDETNTPGLTFGTTKKTVTAGDHKFKYDLTYDVIKGGKLTMTEILPVTFDANGGKFDNFTAPDTETKIVKEVDYDKDLTEDVEKPKKDRETFKGWSTTQDGTPLTEEKFKEAIKNIKEAKTFFAIWDNNPITAEELTVHESFKDGDTWVNDFIPTLDQLKGQVKIKDANGDPQALADDDTLQVLDDSGNPIADTDLKDKLYEKLKEDDATEVSKDVILKAKVTHKNGTTQEVDIPIKVIKNIYEAKTEEGKPNYVPAGYVKVTVDPTTKAEKPQKYFYYVNPEAKVVIPGSDPTGVDGNTFTKWLIDGTDTEYKLKDKPRHKFENETTIKAQYSKDVIPQEGDTKPQGTPDNFVKVTFVPTDNGTMEGAKIFWVNPEKEVTIPVKDPVGKTYYTFKEWKIGVNADGDVYTPSTAKKFTEATTITATYAESENIIPYDPSATDPMVRPDGYVRVSFAADPGLKLTEQKVYYVKANAGIKLGNAELAKPGYEAETGYKFDKWDKEDSLAIEAADIVVTAKATKLDNVIPEKTGETPNEKPQGYKEVTFVVKTGDEAKGSIEGVAKFYVNPTEYVKINPPATKAETGFEFGAWDKDATNPTVYDKDTTITGSFNGLKDIIPKTNPDGTENKQPAGYKKVEFVIDPATGGKIADGEITIYYVNPAKEVTVPKPTTKAETGYEFKEWDQDTATAKKYTDDTIVKGNFKKLKDIIPSTDENGDPNAKPEGYVTVTFEKGEHGNLTGQKVYYVNPKADPAKTLGDQTIVKPEVKAETGYKFNTWNFADTKEITSDIKVVAQYTSIDDVVPKTKEDDSEKPDGYITVTFVKGDHGKELTGQAVYYVNPNKAVVLKDKAPTAVPNTGYVFARWDVTIDKAIQYKDGDKITALYNDPGNISKTEVAGYAKVEFKPGTNGSLTGTTMYWVKPGVEVNVTAPTVTSNVGYKFDKWDKDLTVNLQESDSPYEITAGYTSLDDIIPQKNTDGSDKPDGYATVTFKAVNGTLSGQTVFYVNGEKEIDLTNTAKVITKNPNVGYTEDGGTWDKSLKATFNDGDVLTFTFAPLDDVIEKTDENTKKPEGYVTVKLIPTDKATDKTEKVYFVNPKAENATITNKPEGKKETVSGIEYTYVFTGWTVTKGTVASWTNENINGKFIQDTEITAKYSTKVDAGKIFPAPVPKKDVVTSKGDTPKPEDLIKNVPGSKNDPLPAGTEIKYTDDGKPNVDNPGETTAKVEVKYPNGKTVVVEVPIKVVDNVVPQTGNHKPIVPESYVKVTVDTTDKATANTKFTKVFWVKPNVEVTIPDILAPTGKAETDANGVTKTNNFKKWKLEGSNPEKFYENGITDTFTAKESTIVATYEQDKNVEPVGKNGQWIPQGSNPSPKDFIKNPYDDSDPKNPNNLPPGTSFEFVGGDPDTQTPGTNKTTTIKVIYPNGETREVPVKYNVTGDVVEQKDPDKKPDVPDNFVEVTVVPTEKAVDETNKVFWVNPTKEVTIPVSTPVVKDDFKNDGWKFSQWDKPLTGTFKGETTITAKYVVEAAPIVPQPNVKYVITDVGVQPTKDKYLEKITPPLGKEIDDIKIIDKPDVSKRGVSVATIEVTYKDGTSVTVKIDVIVQDKNMPPKPPTPDYPEYPSYPGRPYIPMYPEVRYKTIIQEKIVKVPMPISDDNYFKEVRYMQGFNGYFRPNEGLTRAEAAQILANALVEDGYKYNPNFKISYKDVGEAWYTRAVKIVTEANVFAGYDDGNFKPQGKITRNEWIATLKRFQELADASGNNMKLSDNHWAKAEIQAAFNEGWLKIYTDGLATYKGDEFIPRQEVAAVSNKAFKRIVDKTYIGKNNLSLVSYKDVKTSMWAYEDILCASNTFLDKKDLYRAHWVKEDKNQFNIDTSDFKIVQKNFQRNSR